MKDYYSDIYTSPFFGYFHLETLPILFCSVSVILPLVKSDTSITSPYFLLDLLLFIFDFVWNCLQIPIVFKWPNYLGCLSVIVFIGSICSVAHASLFLSLYFLSLHHVFLPFCESPAFTAKFQYAFKNRVEYCYFLLPDKWITQGTILFVGTFDSGQYFFILFSIFLYCISYLNQLVNSSAYYQVIFLPESCCLLI